MLIAALSDCALRSCPNAWCNWRLVSAFTGKSRAAQLAIVRGGHPSAEGRPVVGPTGTVRMMVATKLVEHLLVVQPRVKDIEEIANGQAPVQPSICSQIRSARPAPACRR